MGQRERAQPALLRVQAQGDGGAEGAPQQVPVGQLDRLWRAGAPGAVDHDRDRVEVVAGLSLGAARAARGGGRTVDREATEPREWTADREGTARRERTVGVDRERAAGGDRGALARGQPQVERHGDRSVQHAGVQCRREREAWFQRDRDTLAASDAERRQLAGAVAGALQQLPVDALLLDGLDRDSIGMGSGGPLQPSLDEHRAQASLSAPSLERSWSEALPTTWFTAGQFTDIRYEKSGPGGERGIAKVTIARPGGPQRLSPADRSSRSRGRSRTPARTPRWARSS